MLAFAIYRKTPNTKREEIGEILQKSVTQLPSNTHAEAGENIIWFAYQNFRDNIICIFFRSLQTEIQ